MDRQSVTSITLVATLVSVVAACGAARPPAAPMRPHPSSAVVAPAVAATNPAPDAARVAPPDGWVWVDAGFVFAAPPDIAEMVVRGIDSHVGEYRLPGIELGFDSGMYSAPVDATPGANRSVQVVQIAGRNVSIVTERGGSRWSVAMNVPTSPPGSFPATSLTMNASCADEAAATRAAAIMRTVRFRAGERFEPVAPRSSHRYFEAESIVHSAAEAPTDRDALRFHREAASRFEQLAADFPSHPQRRRFLVDAAFEERAAGNTPRALAIFDDVVRAATLLELVPNDDSAGYSEPLRDAMVSRYSAAMITSIDRGDLTRLRTAVGECADLIGRPAVPWAFWEAHGRTCTRLAFHQFLITQSRDDRDIAERVLRAFLVSGHRFPFVFESPDPNWLLRLVEQGSPPEMLGARLRDLARDASLQPEVHWSAALRFAELRGPLDAEKLVVLRDATRGMVQTFSPLETEGLRALVRIAELDLAGLDDVNRRRAAQREIEEVITRIRAFINLRPEFTVGIEVLRGLIEEQRGNVDSIVTRGRASIHYREAVRLASEGDGSERLPDSLRHAVERLDEWSEPSENRPNTAAPELRQRPLAGLLIVATGEELAPLAQ